MFQPMLDDLPIVPVAFQESDIREIREELFP
jgi:hypothetical protein